MTKLLRYLLILLPAIAAPAHAAAPEDPASVSQLIDAGAVELGLARIEARQPTDRAAPRWSDWEGLRCEALARLNRHKELIARVALLPADAPGALLNVCFIEAARAALAQNDAESARVYAAAVLWRRNVTPAEAKAVRFTVVESYIAERRGEDAFRSMLRFQQDYQPLEPPVAQRFAEALLDLGLDREALNWLGPSDEVSPARLRLQLRGATLAPDAVITQARAALARNPDVRYWRAILEAARRSRNRAAEIEALERLLHFADARNPGAGSEAAKRLWQGYAETASEIGNREQLLVGEDGPWADYAARRLGSDPILSRAVYGYLAQRAQSPELRRNAQLQLAFSLKSAGLDQAALRLFRHDGAGAGALDVETRYLLGTIASSRNEPALALELWKGVTPPPNVNPDEWQVQLAQTALRAGQPEAAVSAMKRVLAGRGGQQPELARRAAELAQEMLDLHRIEAAQAVFELALPLANDARAREVLFGLGRANELGGEPVLAAAYYLRSALLAEARAPDALALEARALAAMSLLRAGHKADARAQFAWLVKNSKDPAVTEFARRELKKL